MNAFRTGFRTNCLYGKDLFDFIVSCLFTNIIQWTSQTNETSPDAQSLCRKDNDDSVYMWERGEIYTSPSTTSGTHRYNSEWIKNDDWVNEDKRKTREEKIKLEMEGEIEVWSRKMQKEWKRKWKSDKRKRMDSHVGMADYRSWSASELPDWTKSSNPRSVVVLGNVRHTNAYLAKPNTSNYHRTFLFRYIRSELSVTSKYPYILYN